MRTILGLSLVVMALAVSGCIVEPHEHRHVVAAPVYIQPPPPPPAPMIVVPARPAPPPMVVVPAPVYVPEYYVWDGYEYVGWSRGQYVYLSPGGWVLGNPVVLGRFHGWERSHPHWRKEATRYHGKDPHHDNDQRHGNDQQRGNDSHRR